MFCRNVILSLLLISGISAAPRVDNVLVRMVPPDVNSLAGARMDQIVVSDLYRRMIGQQKLPQLDEFIRDTGFNPTKDVHELLIVNAPNGTVVLARGTFNLKANVMPEIERNSRIIRVGPYVVHVSGRAGFCILDKTLAAAGDLYVLREALNEWQHGKHTAAQPLLASVAGMNDQTQIWGASTGFSTFLKKNLPTVGNGIDFSAIFQNVQRTWFAGSLTSGFNGILHITAANERDAGGLRDTAKGLVGFGRLSVPQNHPELLRFWDGISAESEGRDVTIKLDLEAGLIDQIASILRAPAFKPTDLANPVGLGR